MTQRLSKPASSAMRFIPGQHWPASFIRRDITSMIARSGPRVLEWSTTSDMCLKLMVIPSARVGIGLFIISTGYKRTALAGGVAFLATVPDMAG